MAARRPRHIEVIPLGQVDQLAIAVAAANVQTFTGLLADVTPAWPDPDHARLPLRMQYNAIPILKDLSSGIHHTDRLRLGLINGDLCLPILTYVFGEAQVGGQAAVIGLHRLRRGEDGQPVLLDVFYERLAKVAVHETAHVLGLKHCQAPRCLMAFSMGLQQLDRLILNFCPACRHELRIRIYE